MNRKIKTALALGAIALLGASSIAITQASASSASGAAERHGVVPEPGWYKGHDADHRVVTFYFNGTNQMSHFHVNRRFFGGAHVSGAQWHHTCHNGLCTRARWTHDETVEGFWNDSNQSHAVHFRAHWVSYDHRPSVH